MRSTSSMSSPIAAALNPPTSTSASLRNTPKAPEMRNSPPSVLHAVRLAMKARMYSTTCRAASRLRGAPTRVTRPDGDGAAVDDTHRSTDGHRLARALDERAHRAQQGVLLEDGVGVGDADQRVAGGVDAGVAGVRLAAAVLLADHDQVGQAPRRVDGVDRPARAAACAAASAMAPGRTPPSGAASIASVEPSSTTMISSSPYSRSRRASTESTIHASSLKAGRTIEMGGVSGDCRMTSSPPSASRRMCTPIGRRRWRTASHRRCRAR